MRQGLETRVLRTCLSCKHQKIINPAFEKMQKEQKNLNNWMMWQRSALVAMAKSKNDADYVCTRCQGLQASERTIVLCPQCGTPFRGVLLGGCSKCKHDLGGRVSQPDGAPAAPPSPPPAPPSQPLPPASPSQPPPPQPPESVPDEGTEAPVAKVEPVKVLSGSCSACGNTIRVPLSKIPPRGALRGKCSKCGGDIVVRRPKADKPKAGS